MQKYSLPVEAVIGHNDLLLRRYGNNHQDPGIRFPWDTYKRLIREAQAERALKFQAAKADSLEVQAPTIQKLAEEPSKMDIQKAINKGGRPRKNRLYE
jgi:N-acetyl-anhydromuramyl-L-alanine amidase AmpD